MFCSSQLFLLVILCTSAWARGHKNHHEGMSNCPHYYHRHGHDHSAPPGASYYNEDVKEKSNKLGEDSNYQVSNGLERRHPEAGHHFHHKVNLNNTASEKENEVSEYFLKAYFPELNDFYPGTAIGSQEYRITIKPNIKEIRNKLAKKIKSTTNDFSHAIKTIKTMLNEETIEAVTSLITLPTTEFNFIKNVIKILKFTMENVVQCVSTAGNRLMALPKRWTVSYQQCVVEEFKESWGIVENVHHIFQNAVYYIKNFISKLETCFTHEQSLVQWCIHDIFNDVPSYVHDTVSKLNRELDSGVNYLKGVSSRVEQCEMSDDAEKKLLLPFMIIREMVKCVLSKAEL